MEKYLLEVLKANALAQMANARCDRSKLRVGAAVMDNCDNIYTGANLEVFWQKCYHAEECAILNAVGHDAKPLVAVCVAAERELFTPCGGCMDLIMEFGSKDCLVMHLNPKTRKTTIFTAGELMPHYPTRK